MGPRGQLGGKGHYLTLMDNVVLDKSNDKWKNIHSDLGSININVELILGSFAIRCP